MKHLFLLLLFPAFATAQTYQLEVDYLNNLLSSKEKTSPEIIIMRDAFNQACGNGKTYPLLPYDTAAKSFNFIYILDCPGVPEKTVFKRLKQWCALRYSDIDVVLRHEDAETGKVITKGYAPITYSKTFQGWFGKKRSYNQTNKCYHTLVFTCKEGKIKMEAQDLRYLFTWGGYYFLDTYFPKQETEIYLDAMFPMLKNEQRDWEALLELARQTVITYNYHAADLKRYILNWQDDYKF